MNPNNGRRGADMGRTSDIYQATIRENKTRDKLGMHQPSRRRSMGGWDGKAEAAAATAENTTDLTCKQLWPKRRMKFHTSEPPKNSVLHKVSLDIYTHAAPAQPTQCQRGSFSHVQIMPHYVMIKPYPRLKKREKNLKQKLSKTEPIIHMRRRSLHNDVLSEGFRRPEIK